MSEARRYQEMRASGLKESQIRCRVEDGRLLRPFHDVYLEPTSTVDELAALRALFTRLPVGAVLDGALRTGINTDDLLSEIARHARLRGICQVRGLVPLADPGAQCRQESQIRLVVVDGGLPRPVTQYPVVDQFGFTRYYLDLGWEKYRLAAEYDGRSHAERERVSPDRERHNWLDGKGWTMRYFTDIDLYRRPSHIVSVLRSAIA